MHGYRNEAAFKQVLLRLLETHKVFTQCIETGTTGRGVPDVYCRFRDKELWIEVKNDRTQSIYNPMFQIKWRAGQQAWHYEYHRKCGEVVLTIQAMKDGFVIVPLRQRYRHGYVPASECFVLSEFKDLWGVIETYGHVQ